MSAHLRVLGVLERGARLLRAIGLGAFVDRVGGVIAPSLGVFDVEVDGLRLQGNHIGQLYYVRELLESEREAMFVALLKQTIEPGWTVVEAGAHIGYLTLQCARAVGESGRVFAFEANPRSVALIESNLALNGLDLRSNVVPLALGDAPGRRPFFLSGGGDTSSLFQPDGKSERIDVTVAKLDDWLDSAVTVNMVKLDIEGGEPAALRGMQETLGRAGKLAVFAECNPTMLERAGSSPGELFDALHSLELEIRWIDEKAGALRALHELDQVHGYVNLYCVREAPVPANG